MGAVFKLFSVTNIGTTVPGHLKLHEKSVAGCLTVQQLSRLVGINAMRKARLDLESLD